MTVGKLKKNSNGRYELVDFEFTSGSRMELLIGGNWIKGYIEVWNDSYHWFSKPEGVPVLLQNGLTVRIPEKGVPQIF
jgi:hypothetical protein